MSPPAPLVAVIVVIAIASVLSILSTGDPGAEVFWGTVAAAGAGVGALLALLDHLRPVEGRPSVPEAETLVTLRDSLTGGPIGRIRVVAAVQAVGYGLGLKGQPSIGADEERRLLSLTPERFRAWLSGELDRLERET